jgi:hypothetical protein
LGERGAGVGLEEVDDDDASLSSSTFMAVASVPVVRVPHSLKVEVLRSTLRGCRALAVVAEATAMAVVVKGLVRLAWRMRLGVGGSRGVAVPAVRVPHPLKVEVLRSTLRNCRALDVVVALAWRMRLGRLRSGVGGSWGVADTSVRVPHPLKVEVLRSTLRNCWALTVAAELAWWMRLGVGGSRVVGRLAWRMRVCVC